MKPHNTGTRMSYGTQPSLFDSPTFAKAIHRNSDPDTSRQAAEQVADALKGARRRMYEAFLHGPKTANEAASWCVENSGGLHETYRKRSGELARAGLIQTVCTARCRVTGQAAEVWEVV